MSLAKKIRIAITDDQKEFRDALKRCLAVDNAFEIVLEAENGRELLNGLSKTSADVAIMDLAMPVMSGREATPVMRQEFPEVKVLVITMHDDEEFIIHLFKVGANGYLLKNADPGEIRNAIYGVYQNRYYFPNLVNESLIERIVLNNNLQPVFNHDIAFSASEYEILRRIRQGKMPAEIAAENFASNESVELTRQAVMKKIGVRNNAGLIMFAIKNGIES